MKTIYKYPLEVLDEEYYDMPRGTEFLSVQVQNGVPCLWALVDTQRAVAHAKVVIHGTGHPADDVDGMEFVGTFQLNGGLFVGHVWAKMI